MEYFLSGIVIISIVGIISRFVYCRRFEAGLKSLTNREILDYDISLLKPCEFDVFFKLAKKLNSVNNWHSTQKEKN